MECYENLSLENIWYEHPETGESFQEDWVDVINYEGLYQISDLGRLKTFTFRSPIIMKQKIDRYGYCAVAIYKNKNRKDRKIHQLVAPHFVPNPYNFPIINHKDTIKTNNFYWNIEWCTVQQNTKHAWDNGLIDVTKIRGENNKNAKLNEDDVRKIRKLYYEEKWGQIDIADFFKINKNAVSGIITGRTWFYIDEHLHDYYRNIPHTKNKNKL